MAVLSTKGSLFPTLVLTWPGLSSFCGAGRQWREVPRAVLRLSWAQGDTGLVKPSTLLPYVGGAWEPSHRQAVPASPSLVQRGSV